MWRRFPILVLIAIGLLSGAKTEAQTCKGCGCRGGPGYRAQDGHCTGWMTIGKLCGSPPGRGCRPEVPNAGAEKAAKYGVKALRARDED
ncbi:MAG TPA: hypothetical protein VEQ35_01685 [Beijerinckia sp.]|nr:hypothetical protein [Beijerinckia sp.]